MDNFDKIAATYDTDFTFSVTGKAQRKIIHHYLLKHIPKGASILEINCGTGEDAFFLASMGFRVLATDGSSEMIRVCLNKAGNNKEEAGNPVFLQKRFDELEDLMQEDQFDLCFSDFSGINCIDPEEILKLSGDLQSLLKPGGTLILVLFGTNCIWEKLFMIIKGRLRQINRRSHYSLTTQSRNSVDGSAIYYYKPSQIRKFFSTAFEYITSKPVGLTLPPDYLEDFFKSKSVLMRLLAFKESVLGRFSFLSDFGDHYLIEFRRR